MESKYILKVDEQGLKKILSLGIAVNIIELETIGDNVRFNLLTKAMSELPIHSIVTRLGLGYTKNTSEAKLSNIFSVDGERYYSTTEIINMLTNINSLKNGPISIEAFQERVSVYIDRILIEYKNQK